MVLLVGMVCDGGHAVVVLADDAGDLVVDHLRWPCCVMNAWAAAMSLCASSTVVMATWQVCGLGPMLRLSSVSQTDPYRSLLSTRQQVVMSKS